MLPDLLFEKEKQTASVVWQSIRGEVDKISVFTGKIFSFLMVLIRNVLVMIYKPTIATLKSLLLNPTNTEWSFAESSI